MAWGELLEAIRFCTAGLAVRTATAAIVLDVTTPFDEIEAIHYIRPTSILEAAGHLQRA